MDLEKRKKAAICALLIGYGEQLTKTKTKGKRQRRMWVKPWIMERENLGAYNTLLNNSNLFTLSDQEDYRRFMRMNTETFNEVLEKIRPYITKQETFMRKPISAEEKLAVTLRFLATGDDYESLSFLFRMSSSAIKQFVPVVCHYIYHLLKTDYLKLPSTDHDWESLAQRNYEAWQFPNAIAAVDGKHVAIKKPANSGSEYWNYKGFHSIVLMALVTYDYKFLFADVGCQGRISDGGVWANCKFSEKMKTGEVQFPSPKPLPKPQNPEWAHHKLDHVPFVIVGDSAFPLKENIMKPYPVKNITDIKRIFNYRLSRFRRVSENAFGILVNRFRIFSKRIDLDPLIVKLIVRAAIVLHNLLCTKSTESYNPPGFTDEILPDGILNEGSWRDEDVASIIYPYESQSRANRSKQSAESVRDTFAEYFSGPGEVPWQWKNDV